MAFKDLKIGTRLGAGSALTLALVCAVAAVGYFRLLNTSDAMKRANDASDRLVLAERWGSAIATNAVRTIALIRAATPEDEKYYTEEIAKQADTVTKLQADLKSRVMTDEGKGMLDAVAVARDRNRPAPWSMSSAHSSWRAADAALRSADRTRRSELPESGCGRAGQDPRQWTSTSAVRFYSAAWGRPPPHSGGTRRACDHGHRPAARHSFSAMTVTVSPKQDATKAAAAALPPAAIGDGVVETDAPRKTATDDSNAVGTME